MIVIPVEKVNIDSVYDCIKSISRQQDLKDKINNISKHHNKNYHATLYFVAECLVNEKHDFLLCIN